MWRGGTHRACWGAALAVVTAGVGLVAPSGSAARAAGCGRGDTGVVNVSNTPRFSETEETVSFNPRDVCDFIVGSNQFQPLSAGGEPGGVPVPGGDGVVDTGVWSSQDGGRSWAGGRLAQDLGAVKFPLPPNPFLPAEFNDVGNVVEADQDSVFDRHGNAYYESADLYGSENPGNGVVRVWRSRDAGRTFGKPVDAVTQTNTGKLLDRPYLAIDNSGGGREGTLYLAYETAFYQNFLNAVFVVKSTDHGRTFSAPVRVDQPSGGTQADPREMPAVDGAGNVYVAYDAAALQPQGGPQLQPIKLVVARSSNGARSFSHHVAEPDAHRVSDPNEAEPYFTEFISAIAADPRRANRVAVAWPEAKGAGNSRIEMRYSTDGGRHFSRRIDVADDPASRDDQHDHVALTYLPDGRLVVVWRDRRCCGGGFDDRFEVYARVLNTARSGRLTLERAIRISKRPSQPSSKARGVAPDEYLEAAGAPNGLAVAWNEFRGQLPDNVFRRIPLSALSGPRRHPSHPTRHRRPTHRQGPSAATENFPRDGVEAGEGGTASPRP